MDVNEAERVAWIPLAEAPALVKHGEIVGAGTVIAVRLALTARTVLRRHRPGRSGRCQVCHIPRCPVRGLAEEVLAALGRNR